MTGLEDDHPVSRWNTTDALRAYEALRAANPHLPPPDRMPDVEVVVNLGSRVSVPVVTVRAYVAIPDGWLAPEESTP